MDVWDLFFPLQLRTIFLFVFFLILYKFLTRRSDYWPSQGVFSENIMLRFIGEITALFTPLHELDLQRLKKHGKLYGYSIKRMSLYVADPDILRYILVKDFQNFVNRNMFKIGIGYFDRALPFLYDNDWKRVRTVIGPAFTAGKLKKMESIVIKAATNLTGRFTDAARADMEVDGTKLLTAFTMDVIGACAFGVEVNSLENPDHPFVTNGKKFFEMGINPSVVLMILIPPLRRVLKWQFWKSAGLEYFSEVAKHMTRERKQSAEQGEKRIDFLQLIIDAQEGKLKDIDDVTNEITNQQSESSSDKKTWSSTNALSEEEVIAQAMIFLLVGYETTATTLSLLVYNLARNPQVQERLLQEIGEAWRKHGEMNYDVASKLPYLEAVILESLRHFPIATRLERMTKNNYVIPNTTIEILQGTQIDVPVYAMHHNPDFFPDPEKFQPERFLGENRSKIKPYTYLPFGDGPRNCIGTRFAIMNIKICMVHLLQHLKMEATPGLMKPLEFARRQPNLQPKRIVIKPKLRKAF